MREGVIGIVSGPLGKIVAFAFFTMGIFSMVMRADVMAGLPPIFMGIVISTFPNLMESILEPTDSTEPGKHIDAANSAVTAASAQQGGSADHIIIFGAIVAILFIIAFIFYKYLEAKEAREIAALGSLSLRGTSLEQSPGLQGTRPKEPLKAVESINDDLDKKGAKRDSTNVKRKIVLDKQ